MKISLALQIAGSAIIIAGVATFQSQLAIILAGLFCVLFGIASETRGK